MTWEKPIPSIRGPVDHRRHQRTRLRDEREVARHGATMRETRVEPEMRQHQADAVRSKDAEEMRATGIEHALRLPGIETCRHDDAGPGSLGGEAADDLWEGRRLASR